MERWVGPRAIQEILALNRFFLSIFVAAAQIANHSVAYNCPTQFYFIFIHHIHADYCMHLQFARIFNFTVFPSHFLINSPIFFIITLNYFVVYQTTTLRFLHRRHTYMFNARRAAHHISRHCSAVINLDRLRNPSLFRFAILLGP